MKRTAFLVVAALLSAMAGRAANPVSRQPCRTWTDPVLRVQFPEKIDGLRLDHRTVYQSPYDDCSLRYDSKESSITNSEDIGRHLDIFVFARGNNPIPDGAGDAVAEELKRADSAIIRNHASAERLGMQVEGRFPRTGLAYLWASYAMKFRNNPQMYSSITLMTAWRNRFVKLRYSVPIVDERVDPCQELPKDFLPVVGAVDALFADAIAASKVDVYAIANPTNALVALRRKWLGADTRVSMADMPDYEARFFRLDEIQDWCNDNMAERATTFEDAAREGVRLKIEPPSWYYNLACALARQKNADAAFEALEQAISAGYNKVEHMRKDADLDSIRKDVRFEKLMAMAETVVTSWDAPKETAKIVNGELLLNENNVYYAFNDGSYLVEVETDIKNPIIYLDHNLEHGPVPEGMIGVKFVEEFRNARRDLGAANIHFVDVRNGACIPVVLASDCVYEEDRLNGAMSIPAQFGFAENGAEREVRHARCWNSLGIYTAASDYGVDGIDRFVGYFPSCIAHAGGADEAAKFVRLCHGIAAGLPKYAQDVVPDAVLYVIRHAQKCVTNEAAFMSGIAQRPVLAFGDIDTEKAMAMVQVLADKPFPYMPVLKGGACSLPVMPVNDLGEEHYSRQQHLSSSSCNCAFSAIWGEHTMSLDVEALKFDILMKYGLATNGWRYVWKLLQGDENKVRIAAQSKDSSKVRIEVDYHKVFDAPLANGKTIKTSRVDIGCFLVNAEGCASTPAIVSVYFNPNETREYDANGRLVSIDYTKRQIEGWRPQICPKGNWKDVFRYTEDGTMLGWTRFAPQEDGSVKTNEFTRDGLVVMTRDALGRPKDVRRDLTMTWAQDFKGSSFTGEEYHVHGNIKGVEYGELDYDPCGKPNYTTLAWQYTYSDDKDVFGEPSPKPAKPFAYKPETCVRANFTEASGFRFPLYDQMMAGQARYAGFKYGCMEYGDARDLAREDSPFALKEKGLTPPKVLKKMEFCPWKPSTNDLWEVDADDWKGLAASNMFELADGVYRIYTKEHRYLSVRETYRLVNDTTEHCAYMDLDKVYQRGVKIDLGDVKTVVADGAPLWRDELPEGVEKSMAYWHLPNGDMFHIEAFHNSGFAAKKYTFAHNGADGWVEVSFQELPSRAVGNTVLRAFAGDAEAMNNLAVLLYAEVANPFAYKEAPVIDLLKHAVEKGCTTAKQNLEILQYNRGQK